MISRTGLNPKSTQTYKPGTDSYDTMKKYVADGTAETINTIKDTFMGEDGKPHDLNGKDGEVKLDAQDLHIFMGFGGVEGPGLYTGEAKPDSFSYRYTYDAEAEAGTWFGAMETAPDGTVTTFKARHYGVQDNSPDYQLITLQPNGNLIIESGTPTAEFDPVMGTRGTQPYYGEVGG